MGVRDAVVKLARQHAGSVQTSTPGVNVTGLLREFQGGSMAEGRGKPMFYVKTMDELPASIGQRALEMMSDRTGSTVVALIDVNRYAPQALMLAMQGQPLNTASDAGVLRVEEPSMFTTVEDLAKEEVTCMSLKVLYALGKDPEPARRLANAQFLHRELPVRLSQRAVELMNLPHGLSDVPGIQQVYNCYSRYAWELCRTPLPSNPQEEYEFSCLLSSILVDAESIPRALSLGLQDFHNKHSSLKNVLRNSGGGDVPDGQRLMEVDPVVRADVQDAISRFYTGRIGVRFLVEHHVSTMPPTRHRPGWSGVIKSAVCPSIEARWASSAVRDLCTRHLGAAPDILVLGNDDDTFTYIPSHLEMMLSEQLKNACRAVVERHHPAYKAMTKLAGPVASWGEEECRSVVEQARASQRSNDGGPNIPPIKITVALGKNDVTIKIADEGGGASRSEMELLWTYYYTTANKHLVGYPSPPPTEMMGARGSSDGAISGATGELQAPHPLAGFGIGLPLSRVYARYFGGEVLLKSMEGFGMDSYLHLNRLGHNCEELPPLVRQTCV